MDDSSGHYTSGFFYGNNYWMGSLSLCRSIYKDDSSEDIKSKVAPTPARNSGLPFAKAHQHVYQSVGHENPPFIPGFFVLKMLVNETFMTPMVSNYCYTMFSLYLEFQAGQQFSLQIL